MVVGGAAIHCNAHSIVAPVRTRLHRHRDGSRQLFRFLDGEVNRILITEEIGDDDTVVTEHQTGDDIRFIRSDSCSTVHGEGITRIASLSTHHMDGGSSVIVDTVGQTVARDGYGICNFSFHSRIEHQCTVHQIGVVVASDVFRATQHLTSGCIRSGTFSQSGHRTRNGGNHFVAVGQYNRVKGTNVPDHASEHHGTTVIDMGNAVVIPFVAVSGDLQSFCNLANCGMFYHLTSCSVLYTDGIVAVGEVVETVSTGSSHRMIC